MNSRCVIWLILSYDRNTLRHCWPYEIDRKGMQWLKKDKNMWYFKRSLSTDLRDRRGSSLSWSWAWSIRIKIVPNLSLWSSPLAAAMIYWWESVYRRSKLLVGCRQGQAWSSVKGEHRTILSVFARCSKCTFPPNQILAFRTVCWTLFENYS